MDKKVKRRARNLIADDELKQPKVCTEASTCIVSYYRVYRQWQKNRGRKRKAKKRLKKMVTFYSQFIKKGDLCFDIGANDGNRTEVFLKIGANVVAAEPQEECVNILNEKFRHNEDFFIVPKALDNRIGKKDIYIGGALTISSMSKEWIDSVKNSGRFKDHNWNKKLTVETTTLDHLIEQYGKPVFCKIDVEGFEYNVLQGLSNPINLISFEFTPEIIESTIRCINYLSGLGMNEFNYSEGESMLLALPIWTDTGGILSILEGLHLDNKVFGDIYARFN